LLASGAGMDASVALSELVGVSTQVVEAVIVGPEGAVEAARTAGDERAAALAAHGAELLAAAAAIRADGPPVERVHVDTERGSLVAVSDGERTAVATTVAEPTVGLVAHDLRTALARVRGDGA
jgi:predicted regulator of Ras-like GTPase activity (Roadblock/LC7/MglB family)